MFFIQWAWAFPQLFKRIIAALLSASGISQCHLVTIEFPQPEFLSSFDLESAALTVARSSVSQTFWSECVRHTQSERMMIAEQVISNLQGLISHECSLILWQLSMMLGPSWLFVNSAGSNKLSAECTTSCRSPQSSNTTCAELAAGLKLRHYFELKRCRGFVDVVSASHIPITGYTYTPC